MLYDLNYKKLALLLLPVKLRRARLATFLYTCILPVQRLARTFGTFRDGTDYRLTHNGQVCHLRAVLNDQFDLQERRIYIGEVDELPPNTLYLRRMARFLHTRPRAAGQPLMVNRRGYDRSNLYDFAVVLPAALHGTVDESRLRAVVNLYKLASKRFLTVYK